MIRDIDKLHLSSAVNEKCSIVVIAMLHVTFLFSFQSLLSSLWSSGSTNTAVINHWDIFQCHFKILSFLNCVLYLVINYYSPR